MPNSQIRSHQLCLDKRLNTIDFAAHGGQIWHILGQNGAGKSSLLLALAGIISPDGGEIWINDTTIGDCDPHWLAQHRCLFHQADSLAFSLQVAELFDFYAQSATIASVIENALLIEQFWHRPIDSLSSGQQQRVHLARHLMQIWPAIEQGKALILLDEPCAHLDIAFQHSVLQLCTLFAQQGNIVLIAHHDLNQSLQYATHVGLMVSGELSYANDTESVMTADNLSHAFNFPMQLITHQSSGQKIFTPHQ